MTTISDSRRASGPVTFAGRAVVMRRGGLSMRWNLRTLGVCGLLVAAALALTVAALLSGRYEVSLAEMWTVLTDDREAGFARTAVVEWRLPRALAALVLGSALGMAGAVFQSLTRNPLASPDIIGFTTGSYTGALVVIVVIGGGYLQVAAGALVAGVATAAVVYLMAWRGGAQGFRLIIVGIAVSAILSSVNTWLMLTADLETAISAAVWGAGSLNGTTWDEVALASITIGVVLMGLTVLAPGLRQLELGDDAARATGTRVETVKVSVVILGVALTATVTAAAGPIAFVSLAAPQIARRLAGSPGIALWPAALTGAVLLGAADYAAQHLLPAVLPAGVVTVVIGGGYLVWLLVHEVRRQP